MTIIIHESLLFRGKKYWKTWRMFDKVQFGTVYYFHSPRHIDAIVFPTDNLI